MLARKVSSLRLARTPEPDMLSISETLYSLHTASSVTLDNDGASPAQHPPRPLATSTGSRSKSRSSQNARLRLAWFESILAQDENEDVLSIAIPNSESDAIWQEILDIQRLAPTLLFSALR